VNNNYKKSFYPPTLYMKHLTLYFYQGGAECRLPVYITFFMQKTENTWNNMKQVETLKFTQTSLYHGYEDS